MAEVYKPQKPLNRGGAYLFPRTSADQIYIDTKTKKMLPAKLAEMDAATAAADSTAKAAAAYSEGVATLDATNTTGGAVTYYKCGRLVQVNINDLGLKVSEVNKTTWTTFTVATGLPVPVGDGTAFEHLFIEAAQSNAGRFRVTSDGALNYYHHEANLVRGAKEDSAAASGVITYIAAS